MDCDMDVFCLFLTALYVCCTNQIEMKKHILFLTSFAFTAIAMAQASFDDNVLDVPVDGGIVTIVGSAVACGLYKNRKSKK